MNQLDFSLLPEITSGHTFASLDSSIVSRLSVLPETVCRAESAVSYFALNPKFKWTSRSADQDEKLKSEAFIRASLAEFVSMEDTLPRDLIRIGSEEKPIKLNTSTNPLLHIIRELRNLEIHVRSSKVGKFEKAVLIGDKKIPSDMSFPFLEDITIEAFSDLNNAKHYRPEDLRAMVDWLNSTQRVFGVHELIHRAIEIFSFEIIQKYKLN